MTHIARICERWTMQIGEQTDPESFLKWALKKPTAVSGHLTRLWHALDSVGDAYPNREIKTVVEYFGGMGASALMVEEMFAPSQHWVMDYSEEAVRHLERTMPKDIEVFQADAYRSSSFRKADLVVFDCGDLTAWKTRDGERPREALDRIFSHEPKAILITDIAAPYLHLQRERYETLLGAGTCESYDTYLLAFLLRLEALYGYTVVRGYYDRWSAVMALVPTRKNLPRELMETPNSPVGLELF